MDLVQLLALLAVLVLPLGLLVAFVSRAQSGIAIGDRRWESREEFLSVFGRELGLEGHETEIPGLGLAGACFRGTLRGGREVEIGFHIHDDARGRRTVQLTVSADRAPQLTVMQDNWGAKLRYMLALKHEVDSGDAAFDGRFAVAARDSRAAASALGKEPFKQAIETAFSRYSVTSIDLRNGKLIAIAPLERLAPGDYRALLDVLVEAARAVDRVAIHVRALGGERHAFSGLTGRPRCAFCHADLTGEELDLVACELCATVLHEGCWGELKRCPVLGCPGRTPERARR